MIKESLKEQMTSGDDSSSNIPDVGGMATAIAFDAFKTLVKGNVERNEATIIAKLIRDVISHELENSAIGETESQWFK